MALLNGFMPGEWDYQNASMAQDYPTGGMLATGGWQDRLNGALNGNNPLFNIGLGILANNNSKNLGTVLGNGITAGVQNTQKAQQLSQQKLLQDQQLKDYARKQQEYDRQQKALEAFKTKFPQYDEAVELDPKLAIKAAYPQLAQNSADPYTTVEYDANGNAYLFNHRSTDPNNAFQPINVNGTPVVGAKYSAPLQGSIEEAKSAGKSKYEINDKVPGVVGTNYQTALQADPNLTAPQGQLPQPVNGRIPAQQMPTNNFNTPYPVTFGAPGTTATDQREGTMTDASVAVRNPSRPNVQGSYAPQTGIRVPTPAEQAASKEAAELKAKAAAQAQLDLPTSIANAQQASQQIDELIGSRDGKIKPHPGFVPAVGASSKFDPRNYIPGTEATNFKTRLEQLQGGQFLQAFNSLRGGGAITEIEGKKATDAIARMNTAQTEEEFIKSARDYQKVIDDGLARQQAKAGVNSIMPSNEQMPQIKAIQLPAKPSALTLKKGTVYATPKGNLTWNGKAFED